jgi:hypothetical protein
MSLIDPVDEEKLIGFAEAALGRLLDQRQAALLQMLGDHLTAALDAALGARRAEISIEDGKIIVTFGRTP